MDASTDLIATAVFLSACAVFLVYYFLLVLPKRRFENLPGPPIPSYVFGNVIDVNQDVHAFPQKLLEISIKHGSAFRLFFPTETLFVVTHPEDIRHITVTRNYPKGESFVDCFEDFAPGGLLTLNPHEHSTQRAAIAKLLNSRFLVDVAAHLNVEAKLLFSKLDQAAAQEQAVDIDNSLVYCLLDVISRITLGESLHAQSAPESPIASSLINCVEEVFSNMLWYPFRRYVPGSQGRLRSNLSVLRAFIMRAIEARVSSPPAERGGRHSRDLLEIFLALPDATVEHTIGHVATFLFAGHDTTAHTLSFLILEACKNISMQEKMAAEIDDVMGDLTGDKFVMPDADQLSQLTFCNQVWQESLRMYPAAATGTLRRADRSDRLPHSGFPLEPGTQVLIPPFVAHRSPEFWDAPLQFKPERFAPEAMRSRRGRERSYYPFSAGPRNCIGNFIAKFQAMVLIASVFGRYHVRLDCNPAEVDPYQALTLRPRSKTKDGFLMGLPVTLTRRKYQG